MLGAATHLLVLPADPLARLGTALARLGARAAVASVQTGAAQHEVAARIARRRAVEQCPDVLETGVLAAEREAMDHRLEAYVVALRAASDAVVHLGADVLGLQMVANGRGLLKNRVPHSYPASEVGTAIRRPRDQSRKLNASR